MHIVAGKSGTDAKIENPYDSMPTAGTSGGARQDKVGSVPAASHAEQNAVPSGQSNAVLNSADNARQGEAVEKAKDAHSNDEYS